MFRNQGLVRETVPLSFISSSALISNATLIKALLEKEQYRKDNYKCAINKGP